MSDLNRVKLKFVERAGPYSAGDVYEFYEVQAKRLVDAGIAVYVNRKPQKRQPVQPVKKA